MVDRAGQLYGWPLSLRTVLPPLFGLSPFCGRNGGRFAKNLLRVLIMKKTIHAVEHTPIYDLNAYYQRKRQLQRKQRIKNFIDGFTFLCVAVFTFSMLFMGK